MQKKFKLKDGLSLTILNQPQDMILEGISHSGDAPYDRIISFVFSVDDMVTYLDSTLKANMLAEQGYLFFVYPKKGNKKYQQFIHRDEIFPAIQVDEEKYIVGSDIKFVSLMSLDETFSILSMKRDSKARGKKKTANSQCVSDYESMIPQLRKQLADNTNDLAFYDGLTPGYQKDWARYIYSAKKEETQVARVNEMRELTRQGFKTKELYRKAKSEEKA
ncbi:YdeI/OmpD-associated family protein [Lysinibacillus parviboronicapiens]|uniref:YdeI/OmpD-associated family protein n=1 Tax=Lysinibacillus parviboronicapiens TaxID=436516 RepID=UPI000D37DEC4|nr:YdeI/OmpD-associated family protein [Lysinibacillus parviboronicapiens]